MTEELKIRLSVDTSSLKRTMSETKKSVEGIGKSTGLEKSSSDVSSLNGSMVELKGTLKDIKSLNVASLISSVFSNFSKAKEARKELKALRKELRAYKKEIHGIKKTQGLYAKSSKLSKKQGISFDASGEGAELFKKMGLQADDLTAQLSHLKGLATGSWLATLKASLVGVLGVIGAVVATLGLLTVSAYKTARYISALNKEAHKLGLPIQDYQKWTYVIEYMGGEAQDLTDFIKTLTGAQAQLRDGNQDTIKSFKKLGLSAEKVAKMSSRELFQETIRGLAGIEDQVERTATAYRIFGEEDAIKLTNILSLNNEQLKQLEHNYAILGGYASKNLIQQSSELDGALNNLRIAWLGLKNAMSELFLPAINAVIKALVKATVWIRMFVQTVFEIKPGDAGLNDAKKGVDEYSGSVAKATGAVAKLKKSVLGFDELNILNDNTPVGGGIGDISYGGSSGADYGSLVPSLEDLGMDGLQEKMQENKEKIEDITTGLSTSLGIIMALAGFLSGHFVLGTAGLALAGFGIAVGMGEGGTWERIWSNLSSTFKDGWKNLKKRVVEAWEGFVDKMKNGWASVKDFWNNKIAVVFTKEYWVNLWDKIKNAWNTSWDKLITGVKTGWHNVGQWFKDKILVIFTKDYWINVFDSIKTGWNNAWERIKSACRTSWQNAKQWTKDNILVVFTLTYWRNLFTKIGDGFNSAWDSIKGFFSGSWDNIKTWFNTFVKPVFTGTFWKKKFSAIGDGAKGAFNGLIGIVEKAVNFIIRKLNTLSWKIPDWVPKLGGKTFGFNISEIYIPRLAKGGIASKSTIANVGESGREAILPLENNTQWMDALVDKIAQTQASAPTRVVLNVDGRELGWATIENINSITRQTGGLQLAL